ncbi:hypothetical protein CEP52_002630 [Fusarium oligoseptatum]|uniref:Uncharacterized protein n=1 Tax=Fusarium oligoseptatum TaxID=2604345 RepID=A0A428UCW2_9HYPO|nr:hypothetical protein CEP52_002630 [Fusarium oligoseptatum]
MSFGFGIGDFLAVAQLAHKIRKDFNGAPSQFKSLSEETKLLSIVLQDVDVKVDESDLTPQQESNLEQAISTCKAVLDDLQVICDTFSDLETEKGQSRRSIRRVWKKLKWEPDEARELRERISSSIAMLATLLNQLSSETVFSVKTGVDRLNSGQDRQERLAILNWLSPFDHTAQQNDISARRQAGTGVWLLESPEFTSWKSSKGKTLYCPGIPGAGKTILSSIVVDELTKQFQDDSNVCVAHVYFNYQQQENQTVDQVFGNLLRQLVAGQSEIPAAVQKAYKEHSKKGSKLKFEDISKLLHGLSALYSRVFIIIDALDECPSRAGRRKTLLSEVMKLQTALSANVLCTSRPIPNIEAWFPEAVSIKVRASEHDVRKYLDGQIERLPGFVARSPELQEQVKKQIVQVVDGMFLLAHLHLESLMYKRTPKALRTGLEKLPRGSTAYDETYEKTMKRIETQFPDQAELARDALQWIICAEAPLSVSELQHALAVEPREEDLDSGNLIDADDVVTACGGLVTIDKKSSIIRLVHYTTQEYFGRTRGTWFPTAEEQMAEVCLTYISFQPFRGEHCHDLDEYWRRLRHWPFYRYACKYWGIHALQTSPARILAFFQLEQAFRSSLQPLFHDQASSAYVEGFGYQKPIDSVKEQVTVLHIAALFGLAAIVRELADPETVNKQTRKGWTPLAFAAEQGPLGSVGVVKRLVSRSHLNLNISGHTMFLYADPARRPPLAWAAYHGSYKVSKTLVETGRVDPNIVDSTGQTALSNAVDGNRTEIVDLLLQINDVYVGSAEPEDYRSPLSIAVTRRNKEMVKRLMATNQAKPNPTLLRMAILNKDQELAIALLRGPLFDVNTKDGRGRSALSHAAERGYARVVGLLLWKHNADANSRGPRERTPLSYAAQRGHEQVVEALLRVPNVDVGSKAEGCTPLACAAFRGHARIVQRLLDTGQVDPNSKSSIDSLCRTPLIWAIEGCSGTVWNDGGHEAVVDLLLRTKRVDVNAKYAVLYSDSPKEDQTPLLIATREQVPLGIVKLLIENGADINVRSGDGATPLSNALKFGDKAIIDLLLAHGAKLQV